MYIDAMSECIDEMFVAAQMRHQPQFNLGIIGRHHDTVRAACHESPADLLPLFSAHRNILEVRIGGRKSPGGRKCLIEGSMHASVGRRYIRGEWLYVSGQQFPQSTVVQNRIY